MTHTKKRTTSQRKQKRTASQQLKERRWMKRHTEARQVTLNFDDLMKSVARGEWPSFYTTTVLLPEE